MADSDPEHDSIADDAIVDDGIDRSRYFDYFYDLYDSLHQFTDQNCLLVLDQDNFADFLIFCTENMNQEVVDGDIYADSQLKPDNWNMNPVMSANASELSE